LNLQYREILFLQEQILCVVSSERVNGE